MDPDDLPEILRAEWPADQVRQLFEDLAAGASVEHVQLRTDSSDGVATLSEAREAFIAQQARAIQIRYVFENEQWCDTIMPGEPTTQIIRTRLMDHHSRD